MTTRDIPALIESVRQGDAVALAAWADSFEERGDAEGAECVRGVPNALALLSGRGAVRKWKFSWTGFGELRTEAGQLIFGPEAAGRMWRLLGRWDDLHPALEFLARTSGLPFVCVFLDLRKRTKTRAKPVGVNLSGDGGQLPPLSGLLASLPKRNRLAGVPVEQVAVVRCIFIRSGSQPGGSGAG